MLDNSFELPLSFHGHAARVLVRRLRNGAWRACTEVDGHVIGWEQFTLRVQVDRFRARMQAWLTQAEANERRRGTAA
jgi:hypothetical protein